MWGLSRVFRVGVLGDAARTDGDGGLMGGGLLGVRGSFALPLLRPLRFEANPLISLLGA